MKSLIFFFLSIFVSVPLCAQTKDEKFSFIAKNSGYLGKTFSLSGFGGVYPSFVRADNRNYKEPYYQPIKYGVALELSLDLETSLFLSAHESVGTLNPEQFISLPDTTHPIFSSPISMKTRGFEWISRKFRNRLSPIGFFFGYGLGFDVLSASFDSLAYNKFSQQYAVNNGIYFNTAYSGPYSLLNLQISFGNKKMLTKRLFVESELRFRKLLSRSTRNSPFSVGFFAGNSSKHAVLDALEYNWKNVLFYKYSRLCLAFQLRVGMLLF